MNCFAMDCVFFPQHRAKNEQNKKQADPKISKLLHSHHLSNKDGENKDPAHFGQKVPLHQGVSRLPVLAKSLRLQTPSDFQQSHLSWEEKPLAVSASFLSCSYFCFLIPVHYCAFFKILFLFFWQGKAKKKKPCTRPVPFNLSQPKNTKMATENRQPLSAPQSRIHAHQPENTLSTAKSAKLRVELNSNRGLTKGAGKSHGMMTENASQKSGQPAPPNTLKTSAPSISCNAKHQNEVTSAMQHSVGAEVCLESMNLLSLKEPSKASRAGQNALSVQSNPSRALNGKCHVFLPFMLYRENICMMYLCIFHRRLNACNASWFVFLLVIPLHTPLTELSF